MIRRLPSLPRESRERLERRYPKAYEKFCAVLTSLPAPQSRRERRIYAAIGLGLLATLATPFLLRPAGKPLFFGRPDVELVILTPHNETIRREFADAFTAWFKDRTGKKVRIDWRTPGGTSEIVKIVQSEFHAAFEHHWRQTQRRAWEESFGAAFTDPMFDIDPKSPTATTRQQEARRIFLESNVGIGVDLFFGGGVYDFEKQRRAGTLVAEDASKKFGPAALRREHPDWFQDDVIPQMVGGEPYYDPQMAWVGTCLSSFGIVYNSVTMDRIGMPPPRQWADLADPRCFGQIAVADPSKSGSVVKAFEMIIQQQIRQELERSREDIAASPPKLRAERESEAMRQGWANGLRLIQRVGANARYFTDSATKVPQDVAQGNAGAGMCIDFYGRTFNERLARTDGTSRVQFITPEGGTSIGVDSIALFRGAPQPEVAHAFLEFVLSPEGQALWNYRPGTPGGPRRMSLRRLPIRKDMYAPGRLEYFADPDARPYETARAFDYDPSWTADSFDAIRVAVRVMCIDTQDELREAWRALAVHGFPVEAEATFSEMAQLATLEGRKSIADIMRSGDKLAQVSILRRLGSQFRRQYQDTARLARAGR